MFFLSFIPFNIRFWQCINRYYVTGLWFPNLVNAGKYFSTIIVLLIAYFKSKYQAYYTLYVLWYLFSTFYSISWDYLVDWTLFRGTKPETKYLRDTIFYPKSYYYFSICTNFVLRFTWLLTIMPNDIQQIFYKDQGGLILFLALAEAYRRI